MNTNIPHPEALVQNLFQTADIIFWLEWNKITLISTTPSIAEQKQKAYCG
jgi:hypothetical protein